MRTLAILCLVSASLTGRSHAVVQAFQLHPARTLKQQASSPAPLLPGDWSWVFPSSAGAGGVLVEPSPSPVPTGEGWGGGLSPYISLGQPGFSMSLTRTYGQAAVPYLVNPTVSGGGETSTQTSEPCVEPCLRTYMPLITGDIRPGVYDDFENRVYDGAHNPLLWWFAADSNGDGNIFRAYQQEGEMVFHNTPASVSRAAALGLQQPGRRTLAEVRFFEARLKLGGERTGGWSETSLLILSVDVAGHGWLVQCGMGGRTREPQATPFCNVSTNATSNDWPPEYIVYEPFAIPYDTWHTVRIEANPATAEFRFLLDGQLFGSYVPSDADALLTVDNLEPMIHVWAGDPDTTATHWADDVKITPEE